MNSSHFSIFIRYDKITGKKRVRCHAHVRIIKNENNKNKYKDLNPK